MRFKKSQIKAAKLFEKVSFIYKNYFLHDAMFKNQFKDGYTALVCFLKNYAYERQGSPKAYSEIAVECVSRYKGEKEWEVPTEKDAEILWNYYKDIAKEEFNLIKKNKKTGKEEVKVNKSRNPMNNEKKDGIIDKLASENIQNLATHIRDLISKGNTQDAHYFFVGGKVGKESKPIRGIRGIGEKISSFYLRDIVYLAGLDEKNISDLYLLQPIDTWLEQTLKILFKSDVPQKLKEKQTRIVDLCKESGVSSISFNQGAWVLGSQIAGEFKKFNRILNDYAFAQKVIESHIEDKKEYLREVKNVLDSLHNASYNNR